MNEQKQLFKVIPIETVQKLENLLMSVALPLSQSQHFLPIINQMKQAQTVTQETINAKKDEPNETNPVRSSN